MTGPLVRAARLLRSRDARADARHEWRRRLAGEPALPPGPLRNVLFVCHGNICRSPFAASLLRTLEPALGVRSSGLAAGTGAPADPAAVRAASRLGVSLTGHASRQLSGEDLAWADLVFAMQGHQLERMRARWPGDAGKLRLLGDFLPEPPYGLPDPYGGSDGEFDAVFARTRAALLRIAGLLERAPRP